MADRRLDILLVEDNLNDEMLALHALRKHVPAANIQVVRDGAEALEFVLRTGAYAQRRREDPRVILLDKKLPLVDGMEVLRQLRADPRSTLIPVVMFTSSAEKRDLLESYRLGVNSFVLKALDFELFTRTAGQLGDFWLLINRAPPAPVVC